MIADDGWLGASVGEREDSDAARQLMLQVHVVNMYPVRVYSFSPYPFTIPETSRHGTAQSHTACAVGSGAAIITQNPRLKSACYYMQRAPGT